MELMEASGTFGQDACKTLTLLIVHLWRGKLMNKMGGHLPGIDGVLVEHGGVGMEVLWHVQRWQGHGGVELGGMGQNHHLPHAVLLYHLTGQTATQSGRKG